MCCWARVPPNRVSDPSASLSLFFWEEGIGRGGALCFSLVCQRVSSYDCDKLKTLCSQSGVNPSSPIGSISFAYEHVWPFDTSC